MDPTPIPDDEVMEDHLRVVIGPPEGTDLTNVDIRPIEALFTVDPHYGTGYRTRWVPTEREIERLKNGEPIWVTQWAKAMVPFNVSMTAED
jgi:hypothetical protein